MGYTSKYKGAEIDALLDKVEALPEGGGEGGSAPMMIEVTWEELVALRNAANLTAGQMYRITDYETMTSKEGSQAAGHPFDIIVTALDNKTLDEKASAIWSARDTEGYFANSNLPAWDVRYCLDNDKNRFDWAVAKGKTLIVDASSFGMGEVRATIDGTFEYEGTTYFRWPAVVDGIEVYFLTTSDSPLIGDNVIPYAPSVSMALPSASVKALEETTTEGKGIIYCLKDEKSNEAPYDFKNVMLTRKLTDGKYDAESGVESFVYTFDCYNADGTHSDCSVLESKCRDNRMAASKSLPNNVFLNRNLGVQILCEGNEFMDGSINNTFGSHCNDNKFSINCFNNVFGDGCNCNVFLERSLNNTFGNNCVGNRCASSFKDNRLGNGCSDNSFGEDNTDNVLGDDSICNTFQFACRNNIFSKSVRCSVIGDSCSDNVFGGYSSSIILGGACSNNSFSEEAKYLTNIKLEHGTHRIRFIKDSATASDAIRNYTISYRHTSESKEITLKSGRTYDTFITSKPDGTVIEYTIDDILNS